MQIDSFKKIKSNLYEIVVLDGSKKQRYELYDDIILKYELLIDRNVTKKKLDSILLDNEKTASYFDAIKYLGRKMRTEKEMRIYLKKKEYSPASINDTITRLKKEGYIDPLVYTKCYINDSLALSLDGPEKIKNELIKLGIDESIITSQLDEIDEEIFVEKIKKIIDKKKKVNKYSSIIFKSKLKSYLIIIGYKEEMINRILSNIDIDTSGNFEREANKVWTILAKKYEDKELLKRFKNKMYIKGYSLDDINNYIDNNIN